MRIESWRRRPSTEQVFTEPRQLYVVAVVRDPFCTLPCSAPVPALCLLLPCSLLVRAARATMKELNVCKQSLLRSVMPATVCVCVRVCPRLLLLLMKSVVQPRRRCLLLRLLLLLPRLLLATSVTAHLTHLARPAIGTKMFSSHGNNVVQASHVRRGGGATGEWLLKIKIGISFSHTLSTLSTLLWLAGNKLKCLFQSVCFAFTSSRLCVR